MPQEKIGNQLLGEGGMRFGVEIIEDIAIMLPKMRIGEGNCCLNERIGDMLRIFCPKRDISACAIFGGEEIEKFFVVSIVNAGRLEQRAVARVEQFFEGVERGQIGGDIAIAEDKRKYAEDEKNAENKSAPREGIPTAAPKAGGGRVLSFSALAEDI